MALRHSPQIVTNGLVFYYDMGNTQKSWRGKPTTNFFTNGQFNGGQGIPQEGGSNPTNTVIYFPFNPGNSEYVLEQSMGIAQTEYQINLTTELVASTTYVMSGWYGESLDYSSADGSRMFHSRAFSTSGAHVALGIDIGTVLETRIINGITWRYCYATITTPSDYSNSFNWYVGYGNNNYTGKRYYTDLQMEIGNFPSRFVNGTRSNTQAILDLTGNNITTANSLTYNSDGTFSFNGSSGRIECGNFSIPYFTISTWVYRTSSTTNQGICRKELGWAVSQFNGTLQVAPGTSWTFYNTGYTIPLNTWVNIVYTYSGTGSAGSQTVYINGTNIYSTTAGSGPISSNSNAVRIGFDDNNWYWGGRISSTKIYNRALTASEVRQNFDALKERFFGYQKMIYVASGNITLTNNETEEVTMFKTSGSNSWDSQVYSLEPFTAPCTIEFSKNAASSDNGVSYAMIGWNADPTSDANYTSLDWASYPYRTDNYQVYHNGSLVQNGGVWDSTKRFYIVYDTDGFIRHYNGATLLYSVNKGTGQTVYVDSSLYSVNSTFGGFSNVKVSRKSWNGFQYT
jgi:hypothetical protein